MTGVLIVVLLALLQDAPSPPPPETAVIRGRITDAESGGPVAGAVVRAHASGATRQLATTTRADGTYEFTGLSSGMYTVDAIGGEHDATYIGRGFSSPQSRFLASTPFMLRAGETRTDVDIALHRAGVISGRVVDEDGEPLMGILVRLFRAPGGQQASTGIPGPTDDRGHFRIFGVSPGRYFVCAEAVRPPLVRQEPGTRPRVPLSTCHPSATDGALGHEIRLEKGEIGGVELRMPLRPLLRLSGSVLDAAGLPADGAEVTIHQIRRAGSRRAIVAPRGTAQFTIGSVMPGRYTLTATTGQVGPGGSFQWAMHDLDLTSDTEHVIVMLEPPAQVKGRVVFDGGAPARPEPVTIRAEAASTIGMRSAQTATAGPDLRFELNGLAGPYLIIPAQLPTGWIVKAVRYRGGDITELPTVFRGRHDEIEMVLTQRRAYLSGRVLDPQGQPATGARVLAVPAERAQWRQFTVRGPSADVKDGHFALEQRAGEYLVLAISDDDYDSLGTDVPFGMIERVAQRIRLAEGERREIDLRVVRLDSAR